MTAERHLLAVASLIVCLALIVAGCGGGEDAGSEGETSATTTESATTADGDAGEGAEESAPSSEGEGDDAATTKPAVPTEPVEKTSPPPKVKGGDNSIQNFGDEADADTAEEVAGVLATYLAAQADRDFKRACELLNSGFEEQLQMLAEQADSEADITCESFLKQGTGRLPARELKILADIRVGSVRVESDRGFVIYKDGRGKWQAIPMSREGDSWRVGGLAPTPLAV